MNHRLICQHPRSAQVSAGLALTQHLMTYDLPSMLTVNNYFGVLQAVIHDLGIGILPDYITLDFDGVVRVLDELESVEVPVYLAYPEELRHSKRVEAFRDFVQDEILIIVAPCEMANYPNKRKPCIFCIAGMLHLRHSFS